MPKEEKKEEISAESVLAPQLGTDPIVLVKGKFDMRRGSKLNALEIAWQSFFGLEDGPDGKDADLTGGGGYYYEFCEEYRNLKTSEDGWRTNKQIAMVQATKGVPSVGEITKRPNIVLRNTTQKDWKKKAEEQGRTVVE